MPQSGQYAALAAVKGGEAMLLSEMSDIPDLPPDTSAQLYLQLYNKLATALSLRGVVGSDSKSLLSLLLPGQDIRPGLDPADRKTQYYVSNALNRTLLCNWSAVTGSATISDVYRSVLDGKETPTITLSPEQRRELDEAESILFHVDGSPTARYAGYQDLQLAYLAAQDDYEAARATFENGGPIVPPELISARDKAEHKWVQDGFKREIDAAIATVAALEGRDPALYWRKLARLYDDYTMTLDPETGSQFQYITSNPPYERWFDPAGWSDFRFDDSDFANQRGTGGGGLISSQCCCCRAGGGISRSPALLAGKFANAAHEESIGVSPSKFRLTGRIRRVEIIRPWLNPNVFYSRAWRWSPASVSYGIVVSSGGDIAGRIIPTGVMPVLPTTAILAADVIVRWEDGGVTGKRIRDKLNGGYLVRVGPFRLRQPPNDSGEIIIPGPQLIGFISQLIPVCPNPDPLFPWPSNATAEGYWPG